MQRWRFGLFLLLVVGWIPLRVTAAEPSQLLASGINSNVKPAFDGVNVVWAVPHSSDPLYNDLYVASLADRTPILVASAVYQSDLSVDGDWVVWSALSSPDQNPTTSVFAWNRANRTPIEVATIPNYPQAQVAVSGDWVVWSDISDIKKRSLRTLAPAETIAQRLNGDDTFSSYYVNDVFIDNGMVVWQESLARAVTFFVFRAVPLNGGATVKLATQGGYTIFDVQGGLIVQWPLQGSEPNLQLINTSTGITSTIPYQNPRTNVPGGLPTISGRYVFWSEHWCDFVATCEYFGSWGYDLATQTIFKTPFHPLLARNDGIIWTTKTDGRTDLYGDALARILPTAPQPTPPPSTDDEPFFANTGHQLTKPFGSYWKQHGGLAIFGYPLTDALTQVNADTRQSLQTQYLERQRFEVHPEHAGTPYEILLGRLGDDLLRVQGRNWRNEGHDQPGAEQLPGDCETFAVTNRTVCGPFLAYWHGHGLDLGQPGVTAEESLALFGYPLTAPRYEVNPDGDRVLTQWFERARFEYHPQNQAGYTVLLGRLGAELIESNDW